MAGFVTGEAVALDLPIARVPTRCFAFLLDLVAQIIVFFALIVALSVVFARADSALVAALVLIVVVLVLVGYPVAWETLTAGRTPGKMALGLRVVRADGGPIEFRHALTRGLCGVIVDFWMLGVFGFVAVVSSTASERGRRVGDLLAGTVVIRAERVYISTALVYPPPRLRGWVATLDVNALPDDVAFELRQYVRRLKEMSPRVQYELGVILAQRVCAAMRTAVPLYVHPSEVLAGVLAERQRRALIAA